MNFEPVPCTDGLRHFPSIKAAARAFDCHRSLIAYHLDTFGHLGFVGKGRRPDCRTAAKPLYIRGKLYESHSAAAEALGVSRAMISKAKRAGRLHTVGLGR